jgi:hypothetical protein
MWWGGASVPARFAIPLLPLLAPSLACGILRLEKATAGHALVAVLLGASLATAAVLVAVPDTYLMFNDRDGTSRLLELMQGPAPLTSLFPTLLWIDWHAQLPRVAAVVAGLGGGLACLWLAGRTVRTQQGAEGRLALWFVLASVAGLALTDRVIATALSRQGMARENQLALLDQWTPDSLFDMSRWKRVSEAEAARSLRVRLYDAHVDAQNLPDDPRRWLGPFPIPPGSFEGHIFLRNPRADSGEFVFWFHRSSAVVATAAVTGEQPLRVNFSLPDAFVPPLLWIGASDPSLIENTVRIELVPLKVSAEAQRTRAAPVAIENIDARPGALLGYMDHQAFPEKGVFWTRGESTTEVVVIASGAHSMTVSLEAGAAAGAASVDIGGVPTQVTLAERETKSIDLALRPDQTSTRLQVGYTAGFRPADVDAASKDRRWLGVRVKVTVS